MSKHAHKLRLLLAILGSLLIYILTPSELELSTRIIIAWNTGVAGFLFSIGIMMKRTSSIKMRSQTQKEDESRWIMLIVVVAAACTSLLAIVFMLDGSKNLSQEIIILHIVLALLTIFSSWLLIHIMFALHYAYLYYRSDRQLTLQHTSLEFPAEKTPDYADFVYFSLGIGMTSQVADVQITSRLLRRIALIHQVLTFFFNTLILALAINIMASII